MCVKKYGLCLPRCCKHGARFLLLTFKFLLASGGGANHGRRKQVNVHFVIYFRLLFVFILVSMTLFYSWPPSIIVNEADVNITFLADLTINSSSPLIEIGIFVGRFNFRPARCSAVQLAAAADKRPTKRAVRKVAAAERELDH